MVKTLINYANGGVFSIGRKLNSKSALDVGGFDKVEEYDQESLTEDFINENPYCFDIQKGGGLWIWKPFIILDALNKCNDGDIICYTDSGVEFKESYNDYMFDLCLQDEKGIILQSMEHLQKNWTKRDCFVFMDCDNEKYTHGNQLTASLILLRKNKFTQAFIKEWLNYCTDIRIISDEPNVCGKPNYNGFNDHRHDQSILTNLQIKHNITTIVDITQWGNPRREAEYKQLAYIHRNDPAYLIDKGYLPKS
jgi:hypothetical protein